MPTNEVNRTEASRLLLSASERVTTAETPEELAAVLIDIKFATRHLSRFEGFPEALIMVNEALKE